MILVLVTNCVLGTGVAPTGREATVPPGRGCPAGSPSWMGLAVCDERPRRGYVRADFGSGYSGLEDEIIERLPKAGRARVYAPYTCTLFEIRSDGTAASDIEHIVSLAEAWDSGLHPARRQAFAADLANLTIARPDVNRNRKRDRDAAEWQPDRNRGWFCNPGGCRQAQVRPLGRSRRARRPARNDGRRPEPVGRLQGVGAPSADGCRADDVSARPQNLAGRSVIRRGAASLSSPVAVRVAPPGRHRPPAARSGCSADRRSGWCRAPGEG